jgi:small ligand-binding sensory domain FIST
VLTQEQQQSTGLLPCQEDALRARLSAIGLVQTVLNSLLDSFGGDYDAFVVACSSKEICEGVTAALPLVQTLVDLFGRSIGCSVPEAVAAARREVKRVLSLLKERGTTAGDFAVVDVLSGGVVPFFEKLFMASGGNKETAVPGFLHKVRPGDDAFAVCDAIDQLA